MCPGGVVVGAASEEGRVVTNGMSLYLRDSGIANSAVVVNVTADDMGGDSPLAGIEFQRRYEDLAYQPAAAIIMRRLRPSGLSSAVLEHRRKGPSIPIVPA